MEEQAYALCEVPSPPYPVPVLPVRSPQKAADMLLDLIAEITRNQWPGEFPDVIGEHEERNSLKYFKTVPCTSAGHTRRLAFSEDDQRILEPLPFLASFPWVRGQQRSNRSVASADRRKVSVAPRAPKQRKC